MSGLPSPSRLRRRFGRWWSLLRLALSLPEKLRSSLPRPLAGPT
jgi:hypothetical protein